MSASKQQQATPHYHGHRDRLRQRLLDKGGAALADYEILEFLLFGAKPRADTKPLAKALMKRFGGLAAVLAADHTPVYPREVVRRALELGASALILVHNHASMQVI